MRGVERDAGETRRAYLTSRIAELSDGTQDLRLRHRPRRGEMEYGAADHVDFDRGGRQRGRIDRGDNLPAAVGELGPEERPARRSTLGQPCKLVAAAPAMVDAGPGASQAMSCGRY